MWLWPTLLKCHQGGNTSCLYTHITTLTRAKTLTPFVCVCVCVVALTVRYDPATCASQGPPTPQMTSVSWDQIRTSSSCTSVKPRCK